MSRRRAIAGACMAAAIMLAALSLFVAVPAYAGNQARIAPASALYRHRVEQAAAQAWGVNASPARLAAQLHQESAFRASARSRVGAMGIAQFMPATANWMAQLFPAELAGFDPWNPQQAILAAALYDRWLLDRVTPIGSGSLSECSRWAFALRAYNGGERMLQRERRAAHAAGTNGNDWQQVARFRVRATWAYRENIAYPKRILLVLEPAYLKAGWAGQAVCP